MQQALFTILLLLYSATSFDTNAQQTAFNIQNLTDKTALSYQWLDYKNNKQQASFQFDNKLFNNQFRKFKRYKPAIALRHIEVGLQKQLPTLSKRGAQVKLFKRPNEIAIKVTGNDQTLVSDVQRKALIVKQETEARYLADIYYMRYADNFGYSAIKPDHIRFTKESLPLIAPISQHIFDNYKHYPTREIVNYILSFIQSIPYSTLEDRRESHGSGFSPPNRLLINNQGDCDSKTVLMASVLRGIFPRIGIAIILLPNHALIGIQIPYQKTDDYVEIDGNYYVLAEPTGPALLPVAKIAERSKQYINNGAFSHELVPIR